MRSKVLTFGLLSLFAVPAFMATPAAAQEIVAVDSIGVVSEDETDHRLKRCERVTKNIEARVAHADEKLERHTARYDSLVERVNVIIDRLNEQGYDTTVLQGYLDDSVALQDALVTSVDEGTAALEAAIPFACGDTADRDAFHEQINVARTEMTEVRENAQALKDHIAENIKAELYGIHNEISPGEQSTVVTQ